MQVELRGLAPFSINSLVSDPFRILGVALFDCDAGIDRARPAHDGLQQDQNRYVAARSQKERAERRRVRPPQLSGVLARQSLTGSPGLAQVIYKEHRFAFAI